MVSPCCSPASDLFDTFIFPCIHTTWCYKRCTIPATASGYSPPAGPNGTLIPHVNTIIRGFSHTVIRSQFRFSGLCSYKAWPGPSSIEWSFPIREFQIFRSSQWEEYHRRLPFVPKCFSSLCTYQNVHQIIFSYSSPSITSSLWWSSSLCIGTSLVQQRLPQQLLPTSSRRNIILISIIIYSITLVCKAIVAVAFVAWMGNGRWRSGTHDINGFN